MSKYREIDVKFTNESAFVAALAEVCQERGIAFEQSAANDLHLVGWLGDTRPETAKYIVRRCRLDRSSNDLGFTLQPDGTIQPLISDFDAREGKYAGSDREMVALQILTRVKARYAYHQTLALATTNGYTVLERTLEDGTVELELARYY